MGIDQFLHLPDQSGKIASRGKTRKRIAPPEEAGAPAPEKVWSGHIPENEMTYP